MVRSTQDYRDQVERARRTAHQVLIYGGISFVGGWLLSIGAVIAWLILGRPLNEALDVLLVAGVGSVLGGVALYASSRNLGLAASRLEIDVATKLRNSE